MGHSQEIYQQYLAKPEMLDGQFGEDQKAGGRRSSDKKQHDDLAKQVSILTNSVETMYLEVEKASAQAAKAKRLALVSILLALAVSAGAIVEGLNLMNAMLH